MYCDEPGADNGCRPAWHRGTGAAGAGRGPLAYILAAWLALHTHYYAVFVLVALNLFVCCGWQFARRMRPMFTPWLLWQVLVVALYLPWLVRAGSILSGYGGNGDSPGCSRPCSGR